MVSGVALASPVPLQECLKRTTVSHYVTSAAPLLSAFGIPLFVPPAALGLRVGVRHKYGIQVKPYNTY